MSAHAIKYLATTLIALVLSSSYLLDGPSEIVTAQAVSGDLQDAIKTEAATARKTRATALICTQSGEISEQPGGAIQCGAGFKTQLTGVSL